MNKQNWKWTKDVVKFKVNDKKIYLSSIIDLFNQEIISYNILRHPVSNQAVVILKKAFYKIPNNTNLMLHPDQGWKYQMIQ